MYLLADSVQGAFNDVVNVSGLLFAAFYILTALATVAYYRRRLVSIPRRPRAGIGPLAAAGFLGWIITKSVQTGTTQERWSLIGITIAGVLLMLAARFILRSSFFQTPRESASKDPQESA